MTRLRVACVGTGFIAGRHLDVLSRFPDVAIVAVADPVPQRADEAAARFGAHSYEDGLALLQNEELDAVWICVPPFAHGPVEQAAVERGLPFFVEKPLSNDLSTAVAIARDVCERNLLTAVGYHWRHLDVVEQVAALLRNAPAHLAVGSWADSTPAAPWWSRRERSGGQVIEQTTHILDLARLLVGEVDSVQAVEAVIPRPAFPEANTPTATTAILRFSSGAVGSLSSTCVLESRHSVGLQLVSEGMVMQLSERNLRDHELRVEGAGRDDVVSSHEDPIWLEDREFVDALRGEVDRVRVPYDEALRTHRLACAVDRSAREGVAVTVGTETVDG